MLVGLYERNETTIGVLIAEAIFGKKRGYSLKMLLKRIAAKLPQLWQNELKRIYFRWQIGQNKFETDEPEFRILSTLIGSEDWVIDIGANIGHYTKRFSELVGENGRVIAFEPVPTTFTLLAANVQSFAYANVTLINAAASNKTESVGISIPSFHTGLSNYYEAHITNDTSKLHVLTLCLDSFDIAQKVTLIKIDAEGHEEYVLRGMQKLLLRDHPVLLIETGSVKIQEDLVAKGYTIEKLDGSPNVLFRYNREDR